MSPLVFCMKWIHINGLSFCYFVIIKSVEFHELEF